MPTYTLTDIEGRAHAGDFRLASTDLGAAAAAGPAWTLARRALRGGRREGVELVEYDDGALAFAVVPTRGMGLWRARAGSDRLGWDSPVRDGPVHPALVPLDRASGIGWLDGFDELMVRCGLENNGAPYSEGGALFGLHGRVANIPAHHLEVRVEEGPPTAVVIEGRVDEARLFGPQLRLTATYRVEPGTGRLSVHDAVTNLGDAPVDFQLLYHWNFGPPYLEEGARAIVPARTVAPRDARAVEGIDHHEAYAGTTPGFAEQVYFYEPAAGPDGRALAVLRNRAGDRAVALRFAVAGLPCFTLWKCTGGANDGYVTGLEPATNYPNPKPVERERGRVVRLEPGAMHRTETTLEVLAGAGAVARVEAEAGRLQQAVGAAVVHRKPVEPFTPAG